MQCSWMLRQFGSTEVHKMILLVPDEQLQYYRNIRIKPPIKYQQFLGRRYLRHAILSTTLISLPTGIMWIQANLLPTFPSASRLRWICTRSSATSVCQFPLISQNEATNSAISSGNDLDGNWYLPLLCRCRDVEGNAVIEPVREDVFGDKEVLDGLIIWLR